MAHFLTSNAIHSVFNTGKRIDNEDRVPRRTRRELLVNINIANAFDTSHVAQIPWRPSVAKQSETINLSTLSGTANHSRKSTDRQDTTTNLKVDAAGVAHERLAQSDAALLAPDHATLEHQPVLVDLTTPKTDNKQQTEKWFRAVPVKDEVQLMGNNLCCGRVPRILPNRRRFVNQKTKRGRVDETPLRQPGICELPD